MAYHDEEWGVPVHDDRKLFEFLVLEGAQAGLSWLTILNKRENYRRRSTTSIRVKVARYDERKVAELLANAGIVRNRLKIAVGDQECPGLPGGSGASSAALMPTSGSLSAASPSKTRGRR